MWMERLTEGLAIVGELDPVSQSAGTITPITNVDMKFFHRVLFIINVGVMSSGSTVSAQINEATTSGGTYQALQNFPKAITQLLAAGGNNRIVTLEVRSDELDPGYEFVQLSITVSTAATLLSAICLGGEAAHKPATKQNAASVVQQV